MCLFSLCRQRSIQNTNATTSSGCLATAAFFKVNIKLSFLQTFKRFFVVVQWNTLCMAAYLSRSWPERLSASFWTWHWNCCDLSANVYARSLRLCWSSLLYLLHMREVLRLMAWNSCFQAGCVSWYSFCCCCCYYVLFFFNIQTWKRWWKFMWMMMMFLLFGYVFWERP